MSFAAHFQLSGELRTDERGATKARGKGEALVERWPWGRLLSCQLSARWKKGASAMLHLG